jgi:hypothetical protein
MNPPSILMVLIVLRVVAIRSVPTAAAAALDFRAGKQKARQKFLANQSPQATPGTFAKGKIMAKLDESVSDQKIPSKAFARRSLGKRLTPLVLAMAIPAWRKPNAAAVDIPISTRRGRNARAEDPSVNPIKNETDRNIFRL